MAREPHHIKKLFLVDEERLLSNNMQPPSSQHQQQQPQQQSSGGSTTTAMMKQQQQEQLASPFVKALPKQVIFFNNEIDRIQADKTLPLRNKLLQLLQAIKYFLHYRDRFEREEKLHGQETKEEKEGSKESAVPVSDGAEAGSSSAQQQILGEQSVSMSPVTASTAAVDPSSVMKYGRDKKIYAQSNMARSLHARMRPLFNTYLNSLKSRKDFDWNRETGEININSQKLQNSDIKELVLHKIRQDLNEHTHDPPAHYINFSRYLKLHSISSLRNLRKPGLQALSRSSVPAKRDKTQGRLFKQTGSGGYLNY